MARPERPARPQTVLQVLSRHRVTPRMIRLTLGERPGAQPADPHGVGAFIALFQDKGATDQYVKLLFADPALGLTPPYDMEALRAELDVDRLPVRRTYTVRSVDAEAGTVVIDVVSHGAEGIAGPWAAAAEPGDLVCFSGPGGNYRPDPEADAHVLAGDESALPAIAAALEDLAVTAPHARGVALIEVADEGEAVELAAPAGVEVRWLSRGGDFTPETSRWPAALAALEWPAGRVQAFVHGEREQVKAARAHLTEARGMDRRQMSVSAYWAHGRAEDAFQAEKREPIGQIFPGEGPGAPAAG